MGGSSVCKGARDGSNCKTILLKKTFYFEKKKKTHQFFLHPKLLLAKTYKMLLQWRMASLPNQKSG